MKKLKKNKGVIIFYVLLIVSTLVVIDINEKNIDVDNNYVYLQR